jgi:DNA-binding response OmpR family regulator
MTKLLVIEDDELLREIYATKFEMEGYIVYTAVDGLDGLKQAQANQPQVILLDMIMPHMTGLEFLRQYRPLSLKPPVTTIVISNKSSIKDITEAKTLGARDYLIKSQHTPDDIAGHIRTHLKKVNS